MIKKPKYKKKTPSFDINTPTPLVEITPTTKLNAGDHVILLNSKFGIALKNNIHAYFVGIDKIDNKKFFQPLSSDLTDDEPFEPDNNYNEFFHYKYDGPIEIVEKKQSSSPLLDKLENNKTVFYQPNKFYEFSSQPGLLLNGEVGIINGLIMCVGLIIQNKISGNIIACHYVKPVAKSQDNRIEIFTFISNSMKKLKWNFQNSQLFLFIQNRKEHTNEHTDAINFITSKLQTSPNIINITAGTIKFSNSHNHHSNTLHFYY